LVQKLKTANTEVELVIGPGMPHIWPLLPVMKEAKIAVKNLIQKLDF